MLRNYITSRYMSLVLIHWIYPSQINMTVCSRAIMQKYLYYLFIAYCGASHHTRGELWPYEAVFPITNYEAWALATYDFSGIGTELTHWGRVTHIWVSKVARTGSGNSVWPDRRQAIIRKCAGILLMRTLETNFSEVLSEIHAFSFKKCIWKCRLENGGHFVSGSLC